MLLSEFCLPTLNDLKDFFYELPQYADANFPGVVCIDSGKPGPVLGIAAMTHGNEPVGLGAMHAVLKDQWLKTHLSQGKVYFFLMNLKAANEYFNKLGCENTFASRCHDQDMNRLPECLKSSSHYEVQRTQELMPYLETLTHALDIHSTSQASPPMIVEVAPSLSQFSTSLFPEISIIIRDLLPFLQGKALIDWMGQAHAQRFVIECGAHEAPQSIRVALSSCLSLLSELDMLSIPLTFSPTPERETYQIYQGVSFPDESYAFERLVQNFEFLESGYVIAQGQGGPIQVARGSYAIMPPAEIKPTYYQTDFMYLADRL